MIEDSEETTVSINDVVKSINEEQAIVMGGIDDHQCCSFTKGYMKRQAVYTCLTCLDVTKVRAGFCYPCLLNCHGEHDTLELYTKRNFRCDCGNQKFAPFRCKLWEEKDDENVDNQYNHNFSNSYCICQRPYPDEEYEGNEEMIQCGICEDWFHVEHLNLPEDMAVPEEYEEMTCSLCVKKYVFLCLYAFGKMEQPWYSVFSTLLSNTPLINGHVSTEPVTKRPKLDSDLSKQTDSSSSQGDCTLMNLASCFDLRKSNFKELSLEDLRVSDVTKVPSIFWSNGWRERLCRCSACKALYEDFRISHLLDPQDTMNYYLDLGEKKAVEMQQEENAALSEALSELPHAVACHIAAGVSQLKETLEEFLRKKQESGRVVTEAEIRELFSKLREGRMLQ